MIRPRFASAIAVAGVAAGSMFLAGCGGDDSSAGSVSGSAGASAPPGTAAQMDPGAGMTDMEREMAGLGKRDDGGAAAAPDDGMTDIEREMAGLGTGNRGGGAAAAAAAAGMPGMGGYGAAMGAGGQPTEAKPSRPANVEEWTDEQLLDAVRERDSRATQAIEAKAAAAAGDGAVVALLTKVLVTASEAPQTQVPGQGGYGAGGYPGGSPGGGYPGGSPGGGYPGSGSGSGGMFPGASGSGGSGSGGAGSGGGPRSPAGFPDAPGSGGSGSGGSGSPAAFPGGNSGANIRVPAAGEAVSFTRHVAPILVSNCGNCHVRGKKGEFQMASYQQLMDSSQVVASNTDDSHLWELVSTGKMPPGPNKVPADHQEVLRRWIADGASFDGTDARSGLASVNAPDSSSGITSSPMQAVVAVSSLDVMLGEALLSYAPQATQGTRGSAQRLQQAAQGSGSGSGGYAPPSADAGAGSGGYPGGGPPPGASGSGGYGPGGYGAGAAPGYGADYGAQMGGGNLNGGQQRAGNLANRELVETVIGALIENNSIQAWGAVQGIFAGITPTPLPRHESAEIIISKIFASEKFNPLMAQQLVMGTIVTAGAQPQAGESSMRLLAAISATAGETYLKIGPAGGAGGPGAGQPSNNPAGYGYDTGLGANGGGGFDPAGYAAQMGGGSGGFGPPGAIGGAGRPGNGAGPPMPMLNLPESAIPQAAQLLWGPQISQTVSGQVLSASSVDQALPLLTLATTVPTADVRNATFDLYTQHHAAGAGGLAGSGIYQNIACDPGQLAVLKSLPRPPAAARERANPNAPPAANPADSWAEVTRQYVYSLRERLSNVSDRQELAFTGLQPIRLHRGAPDPEAAIQIVIPDDAASALGDAAPAETRVYYTRCRFSAERERDKEQIAEHYQSRSKGISRPDLQRGIRWFDGVRLDADGTITTMDVLIQQSGGGAVAGGGSGGFGPGADFAPRAGGGGAAGAMFVVETITVVTRDPAKRGAAASVTALDKPQQ